MKLSSRGDYALRVVLEALVAALTAVVPPPEWKALVPFAARAR